MQTQAVEWYDQYEDTKERKIYTYAQHGIPGLRMFGYHNTSHAIAPLVPHYHKACFEFSYVVQGNLQFFVDGNTYSLSGGDMYATFPDEVHDTGNVPMSLHQIYWFQLQVDDPEQFLFMDAGAARELIDRLNRLSSRVIKMNGHTEGILAEIFSGIASNTPLGRIKAAALLEVLTCRILESADAPQVQISQDMRQATDYIFAHICQELKMEELAGAALLSVSRFKQKFKQELGTSPRNFINYHKIEAAKKLLQQGKSVTDTAMELGFSSSNYFSAVFRRYTLMSPTEYLEGVSE